MNSDTPVTYAYMGSFENFEMPIPVSARNIISYSHEIVEAFKSPSLRALNRHV